MKMGDETLTLTGELLEMDDDEIDLGERLDTGTELSVDNEDDHLPEATLGTGEDGEITNVRYPVSARKGQEIAVLTDVKNTGDKTCEFRVYLKNPEGKTIDKEPDTYKSVAPGETATIKTSTEWDARWAMPGYDWNLSVELWEIDFLGGNDRLDTRHFTIKMGEPKEAGKIVNIQYPATARKGQEIAVTATIKNTGTKTSEYRVYLFNPEGKTIDKEPDTYRSVAPGGTATIKTSTEWDPRWAMPGYDWNLRLVLYDIDLLNWKDRLDERSFTVKLGKENGAPPIPEEVCEEGEVVGDMICRGGVYVPIDAKPCSPEGAYDATGTKICRGGVWMPVGEEPGVGCTVEGAYSADGTKICRGGVWVSVGEEPEVPGVSKYLTVDEANERVRTGLPCYIKCVLPILDMLPGLPYIQGIPILPGFAITEKP
jgi:acyl-CoA thioesterase FadM